MEMLDQNCDFNKCDLKNGLNEEQLPNNLLNSIERIIKNEGYIQPRILKKQFSTYGGSYLGKLYDVSIKEDLKGVAKETNLFIKHIIEDTMTILSVNDAYYKEAYYYNELSKIYEEMQEDANVSLGKRLKIVKSYNETNTEDIILENLVKKGFKTLDRMDVVNLNFAELAVIELAKFHGINYVLQKKRPEYFNVKLKPMKHHFIMNEDLKTFFARQCEISMEKLSEEHKKKVEQFLPGIFEKYRFCVQDTSSPGMTICHGDFRPNNMMFKENSGKITHLIPLDFQLLYYSCPLNDFFFFIFLCTDRQFRQNHLSHLKQLYFKTLTDYIELFGFDVEDFYPREEFEKEYVERMDFGLIVALCLIPFIFTSEEAVPDFGSDDLLCVKFDLDKRFDERLEGIVEDFIGWGYL